MEEEKQKPSIFDEAKRQAARKRKKDFLRQNKAKRQLEASDESSIEKRQDIPGDEEVKNILERARKLRNDLETKVDSLLKFKDQLPEPIAAMLQDMSKMPEKYQETLIEKTNELVNHLKQIVPTTVNPVDKKEVKKDEKRGRKSQKLRGKKGWISM